MGVQAVLPRQTCATAEPVTEGLVFSEPDPVLGFKTFRSAAKIITGIETMHAIKKGQLACHRGLVVSAADRFHSMPSR